MPEIVVKLGHQVVDKHAMHQECIRVGRSRDNDIVIDHLSVSRHHAEIRYDHGHWLIADLESANGTYVNGQRVTTVPLYHADTITVGKLHLHFFDTPIEQDDQQIHDFADERTMVLSALAPVRACFTVVRGKHRGKEFVVESDRALIGRSSDCAIRLSDWRVSKYHAQIVRRDDRFHIEDLGSWGAIQVNSTPVKESVLQDGDSVQIGGTRLSFRNLPAEMGAKQGTRASRSRQESPSADQPIDYKMAVAAAVDMASAQQENITHDESLGIGAQSHAQVPEIAETEPSHDLIEVGDDNSSAGTEPIEPSGEPELALADSEGPEEDDLELSDLAEIDGEVPFAEASERMDPEAVEVSAETGGNNGAGAEPILDGLDMSDPNIALWVEAYRSGRPAMRRHAARELTKITGRQYDV